MDDEPVLKNQVLPKPLKPMTHTECVAHASEWLRNKCNVILPEFFTHNSELCDVIGFRAYGTSLMIECKVSRGDFLSDKKKSFRIRPETGMGDQRYYCCPAGLIKPSELPKGWGLIYVYPGGTTRCIKGSKTHEKSLDAEHHLLYYYARRANFASVHKTIIEYRGYDS